MCGKTEQESEEGETLHKLPKMLHKMLKHKVKEISAKRCVAKSGLQGKRSFMQENLPAEFSPPHLHFEFWLEGIMQLIVLCLCVIV